MELSSGSSTKRGARVRYKIGVRVPADVDPRMFIALGAIERAWETVHADARPVEIGAEATITSWGDSTHGANSYHKRNARAVDVRSKGIPRSLISSFVEDLKRRIGALGFDVVLEDLDGINEHVHVELDARADQ